MRHFNMYTRILQTCGGFALAFLGCIVSFNGVKDLGLLLAVGGVFLIIWSLPSTTRED